MLHFKTVFRPVLSIQIIIRLTHDVFLISLLFRIVSNLNIVYLPLFMINKVNVTLVRQFLGLYCLSKLIIKLTHVVFLISLLCWIISSLNHIQLPLFMINKVNVIFVKTVSRLVLFNIRLTFDAFLTSLLFRIVSSLIDIHLPLFMIIKVTVTVLRQFVGFYCLYKLIMRLNHNVFLISFF